LRPPGKCFAAPPSVFPTGFFFFPVPCDWIGKRRFSQRAFRPFPRFPARFREYFFFFFSLGVVAIDVNQFPFRGSLFPPFFCVVVVLLERGFRAVRTNFLSLTEPPPPLFFPFCRLADMTPLSTVGRSAVNESAVVPFFLFFFVGFIYRCFSPLHTRLFFQSSSFKGTLRE